MKTLLFIFMTIAMLLWFLSTLRRKLDWPPESPDNQYHLFK